MSGPGLGPGQDPARDRVLATTAGLLRELDAGREPAILDARAMVAEACEDGHLPGAICADLGVELVGPASVHLGGRIPGGEQFGQHARRWGLLHGQPIVVYDDGTGKQAARLWWLLRYAGLRDVRILDGGLPAWRADGGPVADEPVTPVPSEISLGWGRLPTVQADEIAWWPERGTLLDARTPERFRGEAGQGPRAGHIPGAISAPAAECLLPDGRLRPREELVARFESYRVARASYSAVYSGCGLSACLLVAAISSTGRAAVLYPGSWREWSASDRPVEVGDPAEV